MKLELECVAYWVSGIRCFQLGVPTLSGAAGLLAVACREPARPGLLKPRAERARRG